MTRQSEGESEGTHSPEKSGRQFGLEWHERKSEERRTERILFERRIVGVLSLQHAVREMQRPAEVGRVLMEVFHQEPAECAGCNADCGRDCDSPSHEDGRLPTQL